MASLISKIEEYIGRQLNYASREVVVVIDSNGERIEEWNIEGHDEPTLEQLDALEVDANSREDGYKLNALRTERNAKLAETDWTQSRDVTLTNDADWATYRQALRDITDTYSDLDSVVWPTKPE
jgi:hypothetical protein